MASSTWPDGSPRSVDDNEYEILGSAWSTDGVVGSPADTSVVYGDASGMQVKVRSGKYAVVHGKGWYSGTSDITKAISANGTGQPRVDLVVLGLDRSTQLVTEYVKAGTAGANPQPPALQRDAAGAGSGKWEIPLARVAVASGAATISSGNVTVVAPWIGTGSLLMPDVASLDRIWTPTPGTTAVVGSDMYLYTSGNGWRRAHWNAAWGVIGGKDYYGNGSVTAAGVTTVEVPLNLDSGAVTTMTGRRYQVRAHFRHSHNASNTIAVFNIRENSGTGPVRAVYVAGPLNLGVGYQRWVFGEFSETSGSTRTFILTGLNYTGTMDVSRSSQVTAQTCVEVVDMGPSAGLTAI